MLNSLSVPRLKTRADRASEASVQDVCGFNGQFGGVFMILLCILSNVIVSVITTPTPVTMQEHM